MLKIFKRYINNRKTLKSNTKKFYIKKLIFPLLIILPLYLVGDNFATTVDHSSIATALVSVTAIIVAFLVFSMTILLTKENTKEIPNTRIKYINILINNTEVLAVISMNTIFVDLIYMYISNLGQCTTVLCENILTFISLIAMYLTILIIKIAIDDLLFLSKSYDTNNKSGN